jgi:phospholipase C
VDVADAPFTNQLARRYSVATNYHGVTQPSLPNYLAAISGDFQGVWDDCKAGPTSTVLTCDPTAPLSELSFVPGAGDATDPGFSLCTNPSSPRYKVVPPQLTAAQIVSAENTPHWFTGKTLVEQIEEHGMTWKAYVQTLPSTGSDVEYWPVINGQTYKLYAQKHNPFMYFPNTRNNPGRMSNIVPLTQFDQDLAAGVPSFMWISPDQRNDMHGVSASSAAALGIPKCGYPDTGLDHGAIQLGDAFLQKTVSDIMQSSAWKQNSAIVIVWDEDDYGGYPDPAAAAAPPDRTESCSAALWHRPS